MSDPADLPPPSYRVSRTGSIDPATRRLVMAAGVLGGGLLLLVGAWSLTGRGRSVAVPVIEADSRPVRVKPENPGGLQMSDAGSFDPTAASDAASKLGPAAETPETGALQARMRAAPAAEPEAAPSAAVLARPAPSEAQPAEPAKPAPRPVQAEPAKPAAPKPRPVEATGTTQVQLAALDSEQAAKTEWDRLQKRMPGLLDGRRPQVMRVERDGKTLYRLRMGGFTDMAAATEFCAQVRQKGGSCALAAF